MKPTPALFTARPLAWSALRGLACLAVMVTPALAQYKVVAPDGSVTYTDRPPGAANLRVTPMGRNVAPPAPGLEVGLPLDLRQAVSRYPVTLYTTEDCPPCDIGRKLLQQRGIPYTERSVGSDDDGQALERLVGGRTVPSLTVGAQPLRGFNDVDWGSYLDAAGYPKESKLPRNWPVPVAAPLVARATAAAPAAAPAAPEPRRIEPPLPASGPRF
jgi:glutaredoxin